MTDSAETTVPEYLPPAAIAEYISYNQCSRYAKHRLQDVQGTANHQPDEFREGFDPLNILFSTAGEEFETDVSDQVDSQTRKTITLDRSDDEEHFSEDHEIVLQQIRTAVTAESDWDTHPVMVYQASLAGSIGGQGIRGDSDNLFIWSTTAGAEVRVIDIKRTTEEKVYHQIQATAYVAILQQLIEQTEDIPSNAVTVSGGVITQETSVTPVTRENIPSFDTEPRIADLHRIVKSDSPLMETLRTEPDAVDFQLDSKCDTCPYNEGCVTESFEQGHIRLLGLTVAQQQILLENGVTTIVDLAALCRTPDIEEWRPTTYKDGTFKTKTYEKLARTPGVGELLPHLVFRAEAMLDALQDEPSGVSDRPQNWLPGSGRCSLPDDEPNEAAPGSHEWQDGSMIRVYLHVQYDHLRDRLIQLSARVTATGSEVQPQRCSVVSDRAPEEATAAQAQEQPLFERFCTQLFDNIQTVASGLSFEGVPQSDPPIHFYLYTQQEYNALFEALDRHNENELVGAFRSVLEGVDRPDDSMISTLRSEIEAHIILETPSPGLLHAYQELYPTKNGAYAKPRTRDAWSYSPPDTEETFDLRRVFSRRLFDIGAATEYPDEDPQKRTRQVKQQLNNSSGSDDATDADDEIPSIDVLIDPTTADRFDGVNTRMRHGASIPLAYLWAAVGRIDDDWADKETVDNSALAEFELNTYRYRDSNQTAEITPADIRTLGRHLCDVLEHLERSLLYKDSLLTKEPYPIELLDVDTFETPTLADGAEQYLIEEYRANREEKHQLYRQFPLQRILTGDSVPVYVTDVSERNQITLQITGRIWYNNKALFGDDGEQVKRACRRKGAQGTSSGSWMVANPYHIGAVETAVTRPYKVEQGANATIERLDTDDNTIRFTLQNFWNDGGQFGQRHAKWTTTADQAHEDDRLYVEPGKWLILDPQTDDITAERVKQALEHVETNALHDRLESIRHGDTHEPETPLFSIDQASSNTDSPDGVDLVASWLRKEIHEDTYPSSRQNQFITEDRCQFVALQGPPGTGKTAATMAPALLARLYAGARNGISINGLVTAPSNTAIDELLSDVADLVQKAEKDGPLAAANLDIELVRIGEKPADPLDGVTYADYNNEDHAERIRQITHRLRTEDSRKSSGNHQTAEMGVSTDQKKSSDEKKDQSSLASFANCDEQSTLTEDVADETATEVRWTTDKPLTLVFATTTRSWRFVKEVTPGSNPDDRKRAEQELWHILAVDEASMLELPNFLLAGSGFRINGQVLIGGDHRQLPPVQKHDWENVHRRDIRSTAAYLSTLDYIRFLRGDDVLDADQQSQAVCHYDSSTVPIPLVQLNTTYRFDNWVAQFIQKTVYDKDGIQYSSGREPTPVRTSLVELDDPLAPLFENETTVALLTYSGQNQYQQWNPIESVLTESLIMAADDTTDVGVVTPHNAQRGRVQSMLQERGYQAAGESLAEKDSTGEEVQDIQIETVNRFQGGEREMMVVNATVSNPNYIAAEEKFLLTENRINVSFTRHRDLLVVLAPEALLGYLPEDPDLYNQAGLWKKLAIELGETPTDPTREPEWQDDLGYLLAAAGIESVPKEVQSELSTTISLYTNADTIS